MDPDGRNRKVCPLGIGPCRVAGICALVRWYEGSFEGQLWAEVWHPPKIQILTPPMQEQTESPKKEEAPKPAQRPPAAAPAQPSASAAPQQEAAEATPAQRPSRRRGQAPSYTDQPNSQIRKIIAKRLLESKLSVPHYYVRGHADLATVTALRQTFKEQGAKVWACLLMEYHY